MSSRVLMATVAAIALTAPAVAQDQTDPLQTQQEQAVEPAQTEQAPMAAPQFVPTSPVDRPWLRIVSVCALGSKAA